MKKIDLGQSIQILANVGVIAGIVFLGYEIRQNTVAVKSEAALGIQNQLFGIYEMLLDGPTIDIYLDGMEDPSSLNRIERAKFQSVLASMLVAFQNLYVQVREGSYDSSLAEGYWQVLRNQMEFPGMQAHWEGQSFVMSAEFRDFVEQEVMILDPGSGTTVLLEGQ